MIKFYEAVLAALVKCLKKEEAKERKRAGKASEAAVAFKKLEEEARKDVHTHTKQAAKLRVRADKLNDLLGE